MKSAYIPSLDGIRAISIFIVLLSHAGLGHIIPGGLGVTVFFFLSGFLITHLLLNEYHNTGGIHYPFFFARRFFRLFPPLLITLLLAYGLGFFGIIGGGVSIEGFLYQTFYLANYYSIFGWYGDSPDGLGILWSLAVEEHFYLFFPLLLYGLLRKLTVIKIAYVLAFICLVFLGWRTYLFVFEQATEYRIYYASDTRIDSILFGCIMAMTCNPLKSTDKSVFDIKVYAVLFIAICLMLVSLLVRDELFRQTLRYSLQGIALIPLFYFSIKFHDHFLFRWLGWRWMRQLGVYSYFFYLIHHVVIKALEHHQLVDSVFFTLIWTSLISLAFAFLVDKYVDVHFKKIRSRFRN